MQEASELSIISVNNCASPYKLKIDTDHAFILMHAIQQHDTVSDTSNAKLQNSSLAFSSAKQRKRGPAPPIARGGNKPDVEGQEGE